MRPAWRQHMARLLVGAPVRIKIMGIVLGAVLIVGLGTLWGIHATWHAAVRAEARERAELLAVHVAARCAGDMVARRVGELDRVLDDARRLSEGVRYLEVSDPDGNALARAPRESTPAGTERAPVQAAEAPIPGAPGHRLRVGIEEEMIGEEAGWLTRQVALVSAVLVALVLVVAWGLAKVLARPIQDLAAVARTVGTGRLDVDVPVRARDEVGELAFRFNEMIAALRDKERQRQDLRRRVAAVGEDERKRLARELHDETGQALTSLIAGLGALEASGASAPLRDRLSELRGLAERTLGGVQDISRALRPSVLDDLGLDAALRRQCESMSRRFGADVKFEAIGWDGTPRLPSEAETVLYRIVQESITNAVRHGRARSIHVLLQRMKDRSLVVVEDDGSGFDDTDWRQRCRENGQLGLLGIEERATLLGGNLRVESTPGTGTSLFVDVPLGTEFRDGQDPNPDRR